ncbi:MAG: Ig-like domain repeat protein, partial [Actinobacteria bacterium]|nr:Ig-like domain repeat protein [Actinomycetota bacterium]
ATAGTWDPAAVTLAYQWLRDGQPIHGATGTSYKVVKADVGTTLTVRVTATADGNVNPGSAVSNGLFVKFVSHTSVSMNRYIGTSSQDYAVTVKVSPTGGAAATGAVTVWVSSKKYIGTLLADGTVTVKLPKQSRGLHIVIVSYPGSDTVEASTGFSGFLVFR